MPNSIRIEDIESLGIGEQTEWKNLLMIHKFALEEITTKVNILNEEFTLSRDYNPIEHVKTRLKKPKSIKDKLTRLGYDVNIENTRKYITDISGVRIICSFKNDIFTVADMIKNQDDIEIIRVSDYITKPKDNGYRSYHMIVNVPVFLSNQTIKVCVEIQIRTSAMDFWASLEHKIYYKYHNNAPIELLDELKDCARMSAELDERMYSVKSKIYNGLNK